MSTVKNVLTNIEVVHLDFRLWSGMRKLTPEDLSLPDGSLPPRELASLGMIHLIDKDVLAPFNALKKRAERACEDMAVRFVGAYAVPVDRVDSLIIFLDQVMRDFNDAKQVMLNAYDAKVTEFCDKYPDYAHVIRKRVPTRKHLEGVISCDYQAFQIGISSSPRGAEQTSKQVNGLSGTLARELAAEANSIWESSFSGRDVIQQKSLGQIRVLAEKVKSFAFLNPDVKQMAINLTNVLNELPRTGPITGRDLSALTGMLLLVANPDRMRDHAVALAADKAQQQSVVPPPPLAAPARAQKRTAAFV